MNLERTAGPKAGAKEWTGLAVIALACVLYVMDLTVLHLAVPSISADLRPTSVQLLWIIDVYGFMVAGALVTMGTLGDRIGRRRLLLIGAIAFGVASVIAALSTTAEMLIATRALLGLAGATIAPSTLSLIRNMFLDPRQRTRAISIWVTSFSLGAAIGPLLGGLVLEYFWWGAAFLINVPVMVLLLVLGPRLLPEYKDPRAGRIDLLSAAMSLVAVLAVIFGFKLIAQDGPGTLPIASIVIGLVVGTAFVRRQRTLDDPFFDLELFKSRAFAVSLLTYGLGAFAVFGGFLFLPQFLQLVRGLSPLQAGLWTLPWALSFVVGSQLVPRIVGRVRPSTVIAVGLVMAGIGFAAFTQVNRTSGTALIFVGSVLFSLGTAPLFTLTNDLMIGSVPPERAGAAAGLSETAAELSGAVGIAVFGSIGVAIYRRGIDAASLPDLPAGAAATVRDTLGGALEVAAQLPERIGSIVIAVARDAFTQGFHVSATISALCASVLAVVVAASLRDVRMTEHPEDAWDEDPATPTDDLEPAESS